MLNVETIIERLGGRDEISRDFGASRTAIYNWHHDGIPARLWPDFVAKADKLGIEGVTFDVLKATRRSKRKVA